MKLTIFMVPPQRGQRSGSTCQTRLIRAAHRRRVREADGDRVSCCSCGVSSAVLARVPRLLLESVRYERRPIRTGESVVLAVELSPDSWPDDSGNLSIQVPPGVVVETPALRDEAAHTVYWRLGLRDPVDEPLTVQAGFHTFQKSFIGTDDTDRLCNVSPRRPGTGFFDRLIYPGEPGFGGDLPVRSIDLRYPKRSTPIFGIDIPWWGTFFIVSMLSALCVRPFLKVQF